MRQHGPHEGDFEPTHALLSWVPDLIPEVWLLSAGQLFIFIGQGFTLVYASIYFVNQLGFSATQVGLALGCSGIAGTIGRFFAGNSVETPGIGRRGTLIVSSVLSAIACFVLAIATTLPLLILGNVLLGLGISFYWPATLTLITDLTSAHQRTEAFALTRLADNLGLGLGAFLAGQYIALSGDFRVLFVCKGIAYLLFGVIIAWAIAETLSPELAEARLTSSDWRSVLRQWQSVLGDRTFIPYLAANLFFTTYVAQLSSTLPLYLSNFVPAGNTATGFSEQWISYFFVWHAALKIIFQLPITRAIQSINYVVVLLGALGLWASGFILVWLTGVVPMNAVFVAIGAFAVIAIAEILYAPAATAIVSDIAPVHLRGIYFSLDSECWAIGFLIGPAIGGWALDHAANGSYIWLGLAISASITTGLLFVLKHRRATTRITL
ncbi:MAG: MFS transporter [Leptolyngbyaceae bacterium]|nr:MFS transporter [Leptolyngbyaceae bacterium]